MFKSLLEIARNSPFASPFTAQCNAERTNDLSPVPGRVISAASAVKDPGRSNLRLGLFLSIKFQNSLSYYK